MVMEEVWDSTFVGNIILISSSKSVSIIYLKERLNVIAIQESIRRRKGLLVITGDMARGQA
jgi:hypothetical protein